VQGSKTGTWSDASGVHWLHADESHEGRAIADLGILLPLAAFTASLLLAVTAVTQVLHDASLAVRAAAAV
jgi:hypothetical protein